MVSVAVFVRCCSSLVNQTLFRSAGCTGDEIHPALRNRGLVYETSAAVTVVPVVRAHGVLGVCYCLSEVLQ